MSQPKDTEAQQANLRALGNHKDELAAMGEQYLVPLGSRQDEQGAEGKKQSWGMTIKSHLWDSDSHLKSPEERRFLLKLDCAVLITLSLGWFMKYLDQSNLANAYVSGMQQDLHMLGNQYTYMQTIYTICYAIMQIPSTIIVSKVRPHYWLAGCEIGWCIFTFAQAGANNVQVMYFLRAMIALFEASFFPCGLLVLGAWYTPAELAKRTAIFHFTAAAGSAFAGNLQAAVYTTWNGVGGLAGWRWLFLICGCMTAPCSIALFFAIPDYPQNTKAWYLTERDIAIANARCARYNKKAIRGEFNLSVLKRTVFRWEYTSFVFLYIFYGQSVQPASYYSIWLKDKKQSVVISNIYPTFTSYVEMVCILVWGFLSDKTTSTKGWRRGRWLWCFIPLIWANFPLGVLAFSPDNMKLMKVCFNLSQTWVVTSVLYSWANETFASDPEARALTIGSMNGFQYATNAWQTVVLWPVTSGPRWLIGFSASWAFAITAAILMTGIHLGQLKQARKEAALNYENGDELVEAQPKEQALVDGDDKLGREASNEKEGGEDNFASVRVEAAHK